MTEIKLQELQHPMNKIDVNVTVEGISEPRTFNLKSGGQGTVADVTISDPTGKATLTLWDAQLKLVKVGSKIRVENGYVTQFNGKNSLAVGKYGRLSVLEF